MSTPLVCLIVLDGWGLAPPGPGNAVDAARTQAFDRLWSAYPHTTLEASGRAVGLPDGQMGNSEVGHTNLGAGRVVRQDLVRIDDDIESGAFFENDVLVAAARVARESALHLLGLVSDGGVHSHLRHLRALVELGRRERVEHVHVHAFTDGRDTSPHGAERYLDGIPGVATVVGRYYAMDRDRRWDRVKRAYDAIVHGDGARADDPVEAVRASYARDVTDEFVEPVVIGDPAAGRIRADDVAIFFNFRPDRARELSWALTKADFDGFDRGPGPPLPHYVQMTEYADDIRAPVAFPGEDLADVMAQVLARHGVEQLHVAETEKYAHVTYFFDGGAETRCEGEDWELVDSPRDVATYDQKPGMSADGVADHVVDGLAEGRYGFCLVNFANPDMVGHSGSIPATVEAVETVDRCLARVAEAVEKRGGICLVTADHGNAETMLTADGSPHTAHTTNPVPLIVTDHGARLRDGGRLADIAPTALDLLGIPAPEAMQGSSLIAD
ncbi:MAG TPA: 2,3-bisphosphoglycerate-independent phosphoglycerate mutase [Gaiellales bacterium]|nr:2,3-bisphosphoglycerate-independent phosphoglycerate mutase [Gaiellales bacterium]